MAQERAGEYPYTAGIYSGMYQDRHWTMRQYAGFGTAAETNTRFRALLAEGATGLSVAFDLPTQLGYDASHPLSRGEVGRVGCSISTVDDLSELFADIDLGQVSVSMTINAPAAVLLAMVEVLAEERGVPLEALRGTVQNDPLKEFVARGNYIFPPAASLELAVDVIEHCAKHLPNWHPISISGYHMAEAGADAGQELGFTFAHAVEYVEAALRRGLQVDSFSPRLAFFFVARLDLLGEVAKFRAARRIWAKLMRERFAAQNPRSEQLRFHTQTAGVELTAQQPEVNLVRVTLQALAAVLGGTQSLHTNGFDEAMGIPTQQAATLALRTQQVLAHESGVTEFVDPLGGSSVVEALTDDVEAAAGRWLAEILAQGGAVAAIAQGIEQSHIESSAYAFARAVESGEQVIVGVNRYTDDSGADFQPMRVDLSVEENRRASLSEQLARREIGAVESALAQLNQSASRGENLLPAIKSAVKVRATLGEIVSTLKQTLGAYEG